METVNIYCDGGARGNPGPAASSFVVKDQSGEVIHKEGKYLGVATNNVAEYRAVLMALSWLKEKELSATIFLDSELVGKQLKGEYRVKNKNLIDLVLQIKKIEREIKGSVTYKNVPRSQNSAADLLVNKTLDEASSSRH